MANELKHDDAGVELTRNEDNALTRHQADSQTTDDMLRAQSSTIWERFAVAASRIIGRKSTGTTTAMTGAETMVILSGQAGAAFDLNSQKLTSIAAPASSGDAMIKGTRATTSELPTLNSGKMWEGDGTNVPVEITSPASTREFFAPVTYATDMAEYGYPPGGLINATADVAHIGFYIPADFTSITEVVVIRVAKATATHRLNYYTSYGAVGENRQIHNDSLLDQDTAETVAIIYEQDISSELSSLASGDYVGVKVLGDATNTPNDLILGVRFKYA